MGLPRQMLWGPRWGCDIIIVTKHVIISFIPAKEGRLIEKNEKQMVLSAD